MNRVETAIFKCLEPKDHLQIFTVVVIVQDKPPGLILRICSQILGRFAMFLSKSIKRKFEIAYRTRALSVLVQDVWRWRGFEIS